MTDTISVKTGEHGQLRTARVLTAVTVLSVTVLDQITKAALVARVPKGTFVEIIPGMFNICHTNNTGVVFGMFPGMPMVFAGLTVVAIIALSGLVWSLDQSVSRVQFLSYGLLIGGAVGNLIDRVRLGSVTDFLDFYIGTHHWPAFNVADSAVCVGVALLLIATLAESRGNKPDAAT
ncbi:MAG: signal peptidase II [Candidatus Hydrogenedentes bacterium]|nr:signal peptidase II [Candidatus Hydrogenedentota bacterium]